VNLNRLTLGGRIVAISGLLLFIDSLIPWFRFCVDFSVLGAGGTRCASHSGWANALSLIAILLAIALVVQLALELSGTDLPALGNVTWAQVQLAGSGLVLLLVLLQVLVGDDGLSRYVGAYLGLVIAAAMLYGAVLRYREPATPLPPRGTAI
jgi:hypothetical protein